MPSVSPSALIRSGSLEQRTQVTILAGCKDLSRNSLIARVRRLNRGVALHAGRQTHTSPLLNCLGTSQSSFAMVDTGATDTPAQASCAVRV